MVLSRTFLQAIAATGGAALLPGDDDDAAYMRGSWALWAAETGQAKVLART